MKLKFALPDMRGGFCEEKMPEPVGIVIFGASGDLTSRKLIPSLFNLFKAGKLPDKFYILGFARKVFSDASFREKLLQANENLTREFLDKCFYVSGDYTDEFAYEKLSLKIKGLDKAIGTQGNMIFYLATPYTLFCPIANQLMRAGLIKQTGENPWKRVIIEKPFGHDLQSAAALDSELKGYLEENQIYRIDHYLGKETVQNILMLRFANTIFEALWNNKYIENVRITIAEHLGLEHRAGYFDNAGLLRDIFQNHGLQLLSMITMETTVSFDADRVRDEKVKLMRSIRPFTEKTLKTDAIRGQYTAGTIAGQPAAGYREEKDVPADSVTETYFALKMFIDNWRWSGVPFYIEAGKRLPKKTTEVVITFKQVPYSMFSPMKASDFYQNKLTIRIQPDEGISLLIQGKHPGPKLCMTPFSMDFNYNENLGVEIPAAYERLLLDCMLGDQMLFWRSDGIKAAWQIVDPVLKYWEEQGGIGLFPYKAGTWGPREAEKFGFGKK